jgi:hypothetical protein
VHLNHFCFSDANNPIDEHKEEDAQEEEHEQKEEDPEDSQQQNDEQQEEEEGILTLSRKIRLIKMSFTPLQIQALKQLFAMSPATREGALVSAASDSGSSLHRSNSLDDLRSAFATPPNRSRGSSDNESLASTNSQRVHHKNTPQTLAKFLAKTYFSASKVWEHLYNNNNRISSSRLKRILDQLTKDLTRSQQKTLKVHRAVVTKYLKKKISAGRDYRKKLLKKKWPH